MMRFTTRDVIPVVSPFRLDFTADVLRRLAANLVDIVADDGTYARALPDAHGTAIVRVRQLDDAHLEVETTARDAHAILGYVRRLLGTERQLDGWFERAARIPWLDRIARECRGVHPPRYASLWEACAHAIVFQQISIHAAGAIMRRMVESLGDAVEAEGVRATAFPTPAALLAAPDDVLQAAGLSTNKRVHLRAVADAILDGEVDEREIEALPTDEAAARLVALRGIGAWSAAVVLLRGFGRLDIFPMRDSGVARSIKLLSGDPAADLDAVLETLGPWRGMLYYHLLLGRLRNLVPEPGD